MRLLVLFLSVIFVLSLTSCQSTGEITDRDKLTEAESQIVLARARKYIQMVNHLRIGKEEKSFVQENLPKCHIEYSGYKQGTAKMIWKINPSYSIKVTSKGDLLDKNCPTRMTISRFKQ